jgi:hypothetical protein
MASAIMPDGVRAYILKAGPYAIEQARGTVAMITVTDGFAPKEWQLSFF